MSIPNALLMYATHLKGYETTPLQLHPTNSSSDEYLPNGQIVFTLPSNSPVDLDSLRIELKASCVDLGGTGVGRLPQDISKLVRRVQVTAGGQELGVSYDGWAQLKHNVDGMTSKEPHPCSHPNLLRDGLDPVYGPFGVSHAELEKRAAVAAAKAQLPTMYDSTTTHIPLKAALDGGAAGVTPADGSIQIIGRHSSTQLTVCGYSADGYTKVMTETHLTWATIAAAIQPDGAQLIPLFEVLNFNSYSTTQSVVDAIAAATAAVQAAEEISTMVSETEQNIGKSTFIIDCLGGFLETVQPRILDLSILPTIEITLHLNTPEVIARVPSSGIPENFVGNITNAAGISGSFVVKNPLLHINAVNFSTSAYDSYISAAMSKRSIELPFKTYMHYQDSNFLDSMSFQTSSRSVDKIHFCLSAPYDREIAADRPQVLLVPGHRLMVPDDDNNLVYDGPGMVLDTRTGEKYASAQFATTHNGQGLFLDADPSVTFMLNINGTLHPSFPATATWWMRETTGALSEHRDPWRNMVNFSEYMFALSHKTLRLNRPGSTVQSASGLDTRNSMLYVTLLCPSSLAPGADATPARVDVWTEHTSLVRVVAPRDIELIV